MIKEFTISNFRKITKINYKFDQANLLITGKNAQGKTSIAEALYFCAFLYSPNTKRKQELISFDQEYSMIDVRSDNHIRAMITAKDIRLSLNHKEVTASKEIIGKFKVLYLDPKTIKLVDDSSSVRRHFLNLNISQASTTYYDLLNKYNHILKQKRKLLKSSSNDLGYLKVINQELLGLNEQIITLRLEYLKELNSITENVCHWLSGETEQISYDYIAKEHAEGIEAKELKYKSALWGNHLDQIDYQINELDVRTYASQGQKRTLSLALNIAQMEMLKKITGEYPLVIFDDIFSEIDHRRQEKLYQLINEKSQVIMITPQIANISPQILKHNNLDKITINNGEIS